MRDRYGRPIGCGASRRVFSHKHFVVKIPINWPGIDDNYREAEIHRDFQRGKIKPFFVPAACKLMVDKETGLPILIMEKVVRVSVCRLPSWVGSLSDSGPTTFQVGKNKAGVIKCFDYAMETTEP